MREQIERSLGLRAVSFYGLSEMCGPGVAAECPARAGPGRAADIHLDARMHARRTGHRWVKAEKEAAMADTPASENPGVLGGPEPDEERTDLLGGPEPGADLLGGPEPESDVLGGPEPESDEFGGPEPDEERTDLLGGPDSG
jgi:hypothetical protein